MVTAAVVPAAASTAPAASSQRQLSSLRNPVLADLAPSGLICCAVLRRAEETLGATVAVTASAASSRRGAAHSRAFWTPCSRRGAAHSRAPCAPCLTPRTAVLPARFPTGTTCAAASFARVPSAAAPSVVRLVLIRDTVNLPSVIPLPQTSRPRRVQSSRTTGTVISGRKLTPPKCSATRWPGEELDHDRHADRDLADEPRPGRNPPFPRSRAEDGT